MPEQHSVGSAGINMVLVIIFIVTALWSCLDLTSQLCYSSMGYGHGRQFYDIDDMCQQCLFMQVYKNHGSRLDIYMCVATISGAVQFVTCFVHLFVAAYSCTMLVILKVCEV